MGEFFSVLCSVFWAGAIIFYKKSGESFSPRALNLYKNAISGSIFLIACLLIGERLIPENFQLIDFLLLGLSGLLGIALADTFLFMSINRLGASLIGIIEAVYLPSVFFITAVFFKEQITTKTYIGAELVAVAIVISSVDLEQTKHLSLKLLLPGVFYGVLGMFLTAFSIVMIKKPFIVDYSILEKYSAIWSATVRICCAVVFLFIFYSFGDDKGFFKRFKDNRMWHFVIPGTLCGGVFSMFSWVLGMKLIDKVSLGAVLNQLAIVFIIIFAALFLKEKITFKKFISLLFAIVGGLVVIL